MTMTTVMVVCAAGTDTAATTGLGSYRVSRRVLKQFPLLVMALPWSEGTGGGFPGNGCKSRCIDGRSRLPEVAGVLRGVLPIFSLIGQMGETNAYH